MSMFRLIHVCRLIAAVGGLSLLGLPLPSPARAATVVYYSTADGFSGWCAGLASGTAQSCALGECVKAGGTACRAVLECVGGWGAVADAAAPAKGFGATCGITEARLARSVALVKCMVASNALCWTRTTFDGNARQAQPGDNLRFDLTFLIQAMLQIRGYAVKGADGVLGPETQAAIRTFEGALGLPPSGAINNDLFLRLLIAVGGEQVLGAKLKSGVIDGNEQLMAPLAYSYSSAPQPVRTYSEQLMGWPVADRLTALAILVSTAGSKCTMPARAAEPVGAASGGTWAVTCVEGSFLLTVDGARRVLVRTGNPSGPPVQLNPDPLPGLTPPR